MCTICKFKSWKWVFFFFLTMTLKKCEFSKELCDNIKRWPKRLKTFLLYVYISHKLFISPWLSKSRSISYYFMILRFHLPKTIQIFQESLWSFRIGRIVWFWQSQTTLVFLVIFFNLTEDSVGPKWKIES